MHFKLIQFYFFTNQNSILIWPHTQTKKPYSYTLRLSVEKNQYLLVWKTSTLHMLHKNFHIHSNQHGLFDDWLLSMSWLLRRVCGCWLQQWYVLYDIKDVWNVNLTLYIAVYSRCDNCVRDVRDWTQMQMRLRVSAVQITPIHKKYSSEVYS